MLTFLLLLPAAACIWLLLLRCRRSHPAWETLARFRYAHRGLHDQEHGVPENSLPAFQRAVNRGYGAELDVHLTKDGKLAVIHDGTLQRMCGAEGEVCEKTWEELSALHLDGTGYKIPLLSEVLPLFEGKTPLIIELKTDHGNADALSEAVCAMLDRYHVDYCIESFDPRVLMWLRKHRPDICRGQLSANFLHGKSENGFLGRFCLTFLLSNCLTVPDFIAYDHVTRCRVPLALARRVWGVREVSWTIRSPAQLEQCENAGRIPIFENFIP